MERYTDLARETLKELMPRIEDRVGVSLEGIVLQGVREADPSPMGTRLSTNTISINEEGFYDVERSHGRAYLDYNLQRGLIHETSHILHKKLFLNKGIVLLDIDETPSETQNHFNTILAKDYLSFLEGFASYMTFDHLKDLFNPGLRALLMLERKGYLKPSKFRKATYSLDYDPYERGYKFFKDIIKNVGRKDFLKIATIPPKSEEEMLNYKTYLSRVHHFLK